jgi:hypothetical protein
VQCYSFKKANQIRDIQRITTLETEFPYCLCLHMKIEKKSHAKMKKEKKIQEMK